MKANIKWSGKLNGTEYYIEYVEMNFLGKVALMINGSTEKYSPAYQRGTGYWVLFNFGSKECLLNISPDKKAAEIFYGGLPLSENPVIDEPEDDPEPDRPEIEAVKGNKPNPYPLFRATDLNRKVRNGTGSFFSILLLTVVNIFLVLFNAPVSFPFSLFGTTMVLGTGMAFTEEFGGVLAMVVSIAIAVSIIAFYAILYYFSSRSVAAVWVAFAFLVLDTAGLVLIGFLSQDVVSVLVDIAFHVWILWSIFRLGIAKKKLADIIFSKIAERSSLAGTAAVLPE
jgi:hypothetical protein